MTDNASDLAAVIEETGDLLAKAKVSIGRRIIGQETVVENTLITLLSGGHGLLVGAPGLAKTRLVNTVSTVMGLSSNRVQFTPDLMPAIYWDQRFWKQQMTAAVPFGFWEGPSFANC